MRCQWNQLLSILPQPLAKEISVFEQDLQEIRMRRNQRAQFIRRCCVSRSDREVTQNDLRHVVNCACGYSPWTADSAAKGYITAPGGHRVGLAGEVIIAEQAVKGFRSLDSINIRVARDFPGISNGIELQNNILILGPPGSGKTTLLRDLIRRVSWKQTIAVVDERGELFPEGFDRGESTDVLTFCPKPVGIEMALRTLGPDYIAIDEITATADCEALHNALWCGVKLIATAHASSRDDLLYRNVYKPIVLSGCFRELVILDSDKSWRIERLVS